MCCDGTRLESCLQPSSLSSIVCLRSADRVLLRTPAFRQRLTGSRSSSTTSRAAGLPHVRQLEEPAAARALCALAERRRAFLSRAEPRGAQNEARTIEAFLYTPTRTALLIIAGEKGKHDVSLLSRHGPPSGRLHFSFRRDEMELLKTTISSYEICPLFTP